MSKIEQLISDIEMYLDSCKAQTFSNNKRIVVEKDIIDEMLAELRLQTPEEIKRYQKIIANKDAILSDAKTKANSILADANKQTEQLLSEHEIMAMAQAQAEDLLHEAQNQAQEILNNAVGEANAIREAAIAYTDEQLSTLQNIMNNAMTGTEMRYNAFMTQLQNSLDVITSNRQQLSQPADAEIPERPEEENFEFAPRIKDEALDL